MEARQILIALSLKYKGDWNAIYNGIKEKEQPEECFLEQANNCKAITIIDNNYPDKLKQIKKPPFVLFYNGNIDLLKAHDVVAVSGTREPTNNSIEAIKNVINDSFEAVINTTNTLIGVSEQVAKTCQEKHVPMIFVLGGGTNIFKADLVISEYPNGTPESKERFANRLRIVAGLCDKLYAMEFTAQSSTYMLLQYALTLGKDISVLPVEYTSKFANNRLILDGAEPIV